MSKGSCKLSQQTLLGEAGCSRRDRDVRLVAVAVLEEVWVVADRDAPVLELAAVAADGAHLHHHLVRVELDHDVDSLLRLLRHRAVHPIKAHGLVVAMCEPLTQPAVLAAPWIA